MADILIAIPTYKRPAQLATLLASLAPEIEAHGCRVLVIDNDAAQSARDTVLAAPFPIDYVSHPQRGLSEVRNRALDALTDERFLVFVDDDETVDPGWLDALVGHAVASGSDVVVGAVIAEFPPETPRWILRGRFIQRDRFVTGTRVWTAASNNTLVVVASWRRFGSPRFDPAFSTMGGEDTDLFARLVADGAVIEFCDEAVAREPVAADRITLRWVTQRAYSAGVVVGMIRRRDRSAIHIFASSAAVGALGAVTMLARILTFRGVDTASFERTLGGIGRIASLFGARTRAYNR